MANLKLSVLLATICVLSCVAKNGDKMWEIFMPAEESVSSRFHVLHDWTIGGGDGVYDSSVSSLFPAAQLSDIMLKTMGILREGVTWPGVKLGNLFRRPRATAMFVVDGLPDSEEPLMAFNNEKKFSVDQAGLTGSITSDLFGLFKGDNVLRYINQLFDERPLTLSVSGDAVLSRVIAPSSEALPEPNLDAVYSKLSSGLFDMSSPVDSAFAREIALVQSSIEKVSDLKGQVTDGAPDVYVFMFTSLHAVVAKYGEDSSQFQTAMKVVRQIIQEASDKLVKLYNGNILVQALTLSWNYQEVSENQEEALRAVFKRFNVPEQKDNPLADLPIVYPPTSLSPIIRESLCQDLAHFIKTEGGNLKADCVDELTWLSTQDEHQRLRRSSTDDDAGSGGNQVPEGVQGIVFMAGNNTKIVGIVEERTDDFAAIFLIIFVVVVPLGLSLFAISWLMWNMDPGLDSIIYRNTDPAGMKMD